MAWLNQTPENIASGWGPPPQYHAPEIGTLVGDILRNRLAQQTNLQKQMSDLGKTIQQQQQNTAFGEQASNAGLLPGVDTSNLNTAQVSALVKAIQDQQKTSQEKYYDALTNVINKTGQRPGTGLTQNEQFNQQRTQASILGKQAGDIAGQLEDFSLKPDVPAGFGYVKKPDGTIDYARTDEEKAKPDFVSPTDILQGGKPSGLDIDPETGLPKVPTFTPDVYKGLQAQSAQRQNLLQQQKAVQQKILSAPGAGGGATSGPNDQAISQANQIKANYQAGKYGDPDSDEAKKMARDQLQALGIFNQ